MITGIIIALVLLFGFVVAFGAPYVPSMRKEVRLAFTRLYKVSDSDVVVDLGSGDGVVLAEAASRGARTFGYELNPFLVLLSRLRLGSKGTITLANMWNVTLPKDTTLVYVFAVSRDSKKLVKLLQTQADNRNITFHVMTLGSGLVGRVPITTHRAHALYKIRPGGKE